MKTWIKHTGIILYFVPMFFSCSGEDALEPSNIREDYFTVSATLTDVESQLRRDFHDRYGTHLLFSDTLYAEYLGTNAEGEEQWTVKTVDLLYNITSYDSYNYRYTYFSTLEERQAATEFVTKYVFSHLGEALRPYSVMLLSCIEQESYYSWKEINYLNNVQCLALSVKDALTMTGEEEKDKFGKVLLKDILTMNINNLYSSGDKRIKDFYAISDDLRGKYLYKIVDEWDRDITKVYALGFLNYYKGSRPKSDYLYSTNSKDLDAFCELVINHSKEEVEEQYGEYPIVMQKYRYLRNLIIELGYVF